MSKDKKHPEKHTSKCSGDELIDLVKNKCVLFSDFEGKAYARFTIGDHQNEQ